MSKFDNGGPAFPSDELNQDTASSCGIYAQHPGMTLWDCYAAAALQGYLASGPHDCSFPGYASDAARQADAMLAERRKRFQGKQE